ncbi:MAG: LppX_LprAFG lipoprotein [Chloroflexi bacterium]|nr:LppX_LprAFG lipoprotein [Chloroflexota bacterium]
MALLDSFHFQLGHKGGGTSIAEGLVIKEVDGDVVEPDKLRLTWEGTFGGFFVRADVIAIEGETYMTDPITKKWGTISGEVNPLGFFDPAVGVAAIMADFIEASLVGKERLANTDTYRIQGRLPSQSLYPLLFTVAQDMMVDTEVWVGADDGYLRQVIFRGKVTQDEAEGITRTIRLSGFNAPVEIAAPKIS